MRLIAKAKPVRIRISSGGEEHSSLESLRRNFVWADICQLFEEGSLVKWLFRLNEPGLADKLLQCDAPQASPLEVYNILFKGDAPFMTIDEVLDASINDSSLVSIASTLLLKAGINSLLDYAEKDVPANLKPTLYYALSKLADELENGTDVLSMYSYGKRLVGVSDFYSIGLRLIEAAARNGHINAQKYASKHNAESIYRQFDQPEFRSHLIASWKNKAPIALLKLTGWAKCLAEFSNHCLEISTYASKCGTASSIRLITDKYFKDIKSSNPLYREKMFVKVMMEWSPKIVLDTLKEIPDYPPVKAMGSKHYFTLDVGKRFELCRPFSNAELLEYFVINLPKFSLYGQSGR